MRLSSDPAARRRLAILGTAAGLATLAGALLGAGDDDARRRAPADSPSSKAMSSPPAAAARLTLPQQVGQTLILAFDGTEVPGYVRRALREGRVAGAILFARNVPPERETRGLTDDLQRSARGSALVCIDQEGGSIRILPEAAPELGAAAQASEAVAAEQAGAGARDLRAAGVNVNLAPVADVASGPDSIIAGRGFTGDARTVAALTVAAVEAYGRGRVAATAKHFPGLGAASANTDDAAVTLDISEAEIASRDLPPFRAAIRARVPLIMASHALYPALDRDRIASQSPVVLRTLLRRRLGFRGVVVTDSLEAEAVQQRSGVDEAAVRSMAAGADLLLTTGSASWRLAYDRLLMEARRSPEMRRRVREAAGRVLELKRRLGLESPPQSEPGPVASAG